MKNYNGLLIEDTGECVGYLIQHNGMTFSPNGRINATKEEAEIHNQLLDKGLVDGLDNCQVGQYGTFYHDGQNVTTFMGNIVAKIKYQTKQTIHFSVKEKEFIGWKQKEAECFNFKRTK